MTRGRGSSSGRVVAEQELFFITLSRPKGHEFSGRDDKGEEWRFQTKEAIF
jgi:hypothetical protein